MIRMSNTVIAAISALIATSAAAAAESRFGPERFGNSPDRYGIENRAYAEIKAERERQLALIQQGREEGSITWLERYELGREQARIAELERDALADGHLSRDELRTIRRAQSDALRHIEAERHDAEVRGWWWRVWR